MGRYYSGDIEGKFSFGVQSSDDGTFFHAEECEPVSVNYVIYESDMTMVTNKLKGLLKKYNKQNGLRITIATPVNGFWDSIDSNWLQKKENGLMAGRISMGLSIMQFHRNNPEDNIYFEADL